MLHYLSSQNLSATSVPDAQFTAAHALPVPTATTYALPTATPVVQPLSAAEAAVAHLNLGLADVPSCYHLVVSAPVTTSAKSLLKVSPMAGLRAGQYVELQWYPALGQSLIAAFVLRFVDAAHAHSYMAQQITAIPPPLAAPPELHGVQLGDDQRVFSPGPYGPFDLAQREVQYLQRQGQLQLIFRRGSYVAGIFLLGDFAPIDLGTYGKIVDLRLQNALTVSTP